MPNHTPQPGQERFVAPSIDTELPAANDVDTSHPPESQWKQAWKALRGNWIFWFSAILLLLVLIVVCFPTLFTSVDPRSADLSNSLGKPQPGHIFGFDRQGYDVFARTIHGARSLGRYRSTNHSHRDNLAFTGNRRIWRLDRYHHLPCRRYFLCDSPFCRNCSLSALNNVWPNRGTGVVLAP